MAEHRVRVSIRGSLDALQEALDPPGIDAPEKGPVNGVEVVVQAGPEAGREGAHHCRTPLVGGIEFLAGVADERGRGPTDNSSPARFLRERIIDAAEPGVHDNAPIRRKNPAP